MDAFARAGRDLRGRFLPGISGNPKGKPKGSGRLQRELRRLRLENERLKAEAYARATAPAPDVPATRTWEVPLSVSEVAQIVHPPCADDLLDPVYLGMFGIRHVRMKNGPPLYFRVTEDGLMLRHSRRAVVRSGKAGPAPLPVVRYDPAGRRSDERDVRRGTRAKKRPAARAV